MNMGTCWMLICFDPWSLFSSQDNITSLRMFCIPHPEAPTDTNSLEKQQEDLMKGQMMKIEAIR